jgi:hypothetical protein
MDSDRDAHGAPVTFDSAQCVSVILPDGEYSGVTVSGIGTLGGNGMSRRFERVLIQSAPAAPAMIGNTVLCMFEQETMDADGLAPAAAPA